MAKTRMKEQPCYECSGVGTITTPFSPGGHEAYIRFIDKVCERCDGTGVI